MSSIFFPLCKVLKVFKIPWMKEFTSDTVFGGRNQNLMPNCSSPFFFFKKKKKRYVLSHVFIISQKHLDSYSQWSQVFHRKEKSQ